LRLPDFFHPHDGDEIPAQLSGATIIGFGTSEERIEGGGLVIDYKSKNKSQVQRLVLGFNELGMWIHRKSSLDGGQECDL
jgi:hypothetical protein